MSKDLTSKSIAEEIINLCYANAIKNYTDKKDNVIWYMDSEFVGKIIDGHLPDLIDELVKQKSGKDFDRGYACAVANLINLHGISTEAVETFNQMFASFKSLKDIGLSEFDAEILKKHF